MFEHGKKIRPHSENIEHRQKILNTTNFMEQADGLGMSQQRL